MTDTTIQALIAQGATRWTKGAHDRLYLNAAALELAGLKISRYKTGNVSYAELNGEKISHSRGADMADSLEVAYIDLNTGNIIADASVKSLLTDAIAEMETTADEAEINEEDTMKKAENIYERLYNEVEENDGDIQELRNDSEGGYPYGLNMACRDGIPVALCWYTNDYVDYGSPDNIDAALAEYDETIRRYRDDL